MHAVFMYGWLEVAKDTVDDIHTAEINIILLDSAMLGVTIKLLLLMLDYASLEHV